MSTPPVSLPSPPMQEAPLPPSSDAPASTSAPSVSVVAPIPQTVDEAASSSIPLLITPTPSTAPPPPLPVDAPIPPAPHPEEDPKGASATGLVDAGEVGAMEVEPSSSAGPPPPPAGSPPPAPSAGSGPSTASPEMATAAMFNSQPRQPTSPQASKHDPTIAIREMHETIQRRAARRDVIGVWHATRDGANRVHPAYPSPWDAYYLVPFLLCSIAYAEDISNTVSDLSGYVRPVQYESDPIYRQLATLISAVKTNSHSVIWAAVADIKATLAALPSTEPIAAAHLNLVTYLLGAATSRIRRDIIVVLRELYENLPVSELARYVGVTADEVLQNPAVFGFTLDSATGLASPIPTPKTGRGPTGPRNYAALARGILDIETRV